MRQTATNSKSLVCRPAELDSYRLDHNGETAREILVCTATNALQHSCKALVQAGSWLQDYTSPLLLPEQPAQRSRVLIGHSMGGVCAALEALARPQVLLVGLKGGMQEAAHLPAAAEQFTSLVSAMRRTAPVSVPLET